MVSAVVIVIVVVVVVATCAALSPVFGSAEVAGSIYSRVM